MARKIQLVLDDVLASVSDQLADAIGIDEVTLHHLKHSKSQKRGGYWVTYYIIGHPIQRAVYLGATAKDIQDKFSQWLRQWSV